MAQDFHSIHILSDFNVAVFAGVLNNLSDGFNVQAQLAPFGQVIPLLLDSESDMWSNAQDMALVWTQPQSVVPSFGRMLEFETISIEQVLSEVDQFADLVLNLESKCKAVFIPSWVIPTANRGLGLNDMKQDGGIANILMRMNLRLAERISEKTNFYVLNTQKWVESAGKRAFSSKLWYMGKILFDNQFFSEAAVDVFAAMKVVQGQVKKLIVLDLDDTLWGGIVGDVGLEGLRLGGHDPIGEAFVDFQKELKALTKRGIILGIVSKNEEAVALNAINTHPDMILRLDDFAGYRINWEDKAQNILELVNELNIGLESVVFIDDNPAERARVKEMLGDVLVPDWPVDKMLYKESLLSLRCFDSPSLSAEDATRTQMYITEKKRTGLMADIGSYDQWIKTLMVEVKVEAFSLVNLARSAQLLNKTNQMNLTTRRLTEAELLKWVEEANHFLWTFRVSDKFGDSGLVGIVSCELREGVVQIIDFILSCRVFSRKIEEVMLHVVTSFACAQQINKVEAYFVATKKNAPCLKFLEGSGSTVESNAELFVWENEKPYALPEGLNVSGIQGCFEKKVS